MVKDDKSKPKKAKSKDGKSETNKPEAKKPEAKKPEAKKPKAPEDNLPEKFENESKPVEAPEKMPELGKILNVAAPLLEGFLSSYEEPKPEPKPDTSQEPKRKQINDCEVHIIGSEEMILKLFGIA